MFFCIILSDGGALSVDEKCHQGCSLVQNLGLFAVKIYDGVGGIVIGGEGQRWIGTMNLSLDTFTTHVLDGDRNILGTRRNVKGNGQALPGGVGMPVSYRTGNLLTYDIRCLNHDIIGLYMGG